MEMMTLQHMTELMEYWLMLSESWQMIKLNPSIGLFLMDQLIQIGLKV